MERRETCSQKNLKIFDEYGEKFLSNIITEDETTLTLYMPESRRESLNGSCLETSQPRRDSIPEEPSKRPCSSHQRVIILSVFWDRHWIIMTDYAFKGTTINAQFYSNLVECVRQKRRKQKNTPLWLYTTTCVCTQQRSQKLQSAMQD